MGTQRAYTIKFDGDISAIEKSFQKINTGIEKLQNNEIKITFDYDRTKENFSKVLKRVLSTIPTTELKFKYDLNKEALKQEQAKLERMRNSVNPEYYVNRINQTAKDYQIAKNNNDSEKVQSLIKELVNLDTTLNELEGAHEVFDKIDASAAKLIEKLYKAGNVGDPLKVATKRAIENQSELVSSMERYGEVLQKQLGDVSLDNTAKELGEKYGEQFFKGVEDNAKKNGKKAAKTLEENLNPEKIKDDIVFNAGLVDIYKNPKDEFHLEKYQKYISELEGLWDSLKMTDPSLTMDSFISELSRELEEATAKSKEFENVLKKVKEGTKTWTFNKALNDTDKFANDLNILLEKYSDLSESSDESNKVQLLNLEAQIHAMLSIQHKLMEWDKNNDLGESSKFDNIQNKLSKKAQDVQDRAWDAIANGRNLTKKDDLSFAIFDSLGLSEHVKSTKEDLEKAISVLQNFGEYSKTAFSSDAIEVYKKQIQEAAELVQYMKKKLESATEEEKASDPQWVESRFGYIADELNKIETFKKKIAELQGEDYTPKTFTSEGIKAQFGVQEIQKATEETKKQTKANEELNASKKKTKDITASQTKETPVETESNEEIDSLKSLQNFIEGDLITSINNKTEAFKNEKDSVLAFTEEEIGAFKQFAEIIDSIVEKLGTLDFEKLGFKIPEVKDASSFTDFLKAIKKINPEEYSVKSFESVKETINNIVDVLSQVDDNFINRLNSFTESLKNFEAVSKSSGVKNFSTFKAKAAPSDEQIIDAYRRQITKLSKSFSGELTGTPLSLNNLWGELNKITKISGDAESELAKTYLTAKSFKELLSTDDNINQIEEINRAFLDTIEESKKLDEIIGNDKFSEDFRQKAESIKSELKDIIDLIGKMFSGENVDDEFKNLTKKFYTDYKDLLAGTKSKKNRFVPEAIIPMASESQLQDESLKIEQILNKYSAATRKQKAALKEYQRELLSSEGVTADRLEEIKNKVKGVQQEILSSGRGTKSFLDKFGRQVTQEAVRFAATMVSFQRVIQLLREGWQYALQFDTALTKISYTMNLTESQLDSMGEDILSLSKNLKTSISDMSTIYQIYSNMNTSAEEMSQLAESTAILSNLTGVDASTAADQIQGVVQQFEELSSVDASHIVDVFDYISANISVDYSKGIQGIASAVQNVGNVADQAGISFEQLSAIIAKTMEQTRLEGSQIANGLKTILVRISKASTMSDEVDNETLSNASRVLHDIGVEVYNVNGEYREFNTIMSELAEKWDNLTDAQQANISYQVAA